MPRTLAACLLLALALAWSAGASAEVEVSPHAGELFKQGVGFARAGKWEQAYRAFKAAYADSPKSTMLGNLGRAAKELERDGEAIEHIGRYLRENVDFVPGEREQRSAELDELRATVVWLELSVKPAGATLVDRRVPVSGAPVQNRYGPLEARQRIGLRAGHHELSLKLPGYREVAWELDAATGARVQKDIVLVPLDASPPAPSPEQASPASPGRAPLVISLALTGALAAGAVVVGGLALGTHADYEEARARGDRATGDPLRDKGEALNIAADVLGGAALAGAVVTTVLWLTRPAGPKHAGASSVGMAPLFGRNAGGIVLRGVF